MDGAEHAEPGPEVTPTREAEDRPSSPSPREALLALVLAAVGALVVVALRQTARWWIAEWRPELIGITWSSDADRNPAGLVVGVPLVVAALALTWVLAVVRRDRLRWRRAAAGVLGLCIAVLAVRTVVDVPGERCAYDVYRGEPTCVAGVEATRSDLLTLVLPAVLPIGALAIPSGPRRRRPAARTEAASAGSGPAVG